MHVGNIFTQGPLFHMPKNWILIDACSTCDVSNNRDWVADIRMCSQEDSLTTRTNGGAKRHDHEANLKLIPVVVHLKESSMATILSLKTVSEIKGSRLNMDTSAKKSIVLAMENGDIHIFNMHKIDCIFMTQIKQLILLKINIRYQTIIFCKKLQTIKLIFQYRKSMECMLLDKRKSVYSTLGSKL